MARRDNPLIELLTLVPWWTNLLLAAPVYLGLRYALPAAGFEQPWLAGLAGAAPILAPAAAAAMVLGALIDALRVHARRRLLHGQSGLESVMDLRWQEFETLLEEIFRRRGYEVSAQGGEVPAEGDVDLRLRRAGRLYVVQCRYRRAYRVGVDSVFDLCDTMAAHGAAGGFLVTCGKFTGEALRFAFGKPVELIDGGDLVSWIEELRGGTAAEAPRITAVPPPAGSQRHPA